MKNPLLICALCLALTAAVFGCGGGEATSSQPEDVPATTKQQQQDADSAPPADRTKPAFKPLEDRYRRKVVIGHYPREAPFSGIRGGKGNENPRFDPPDGPAPKKLLIRELEVGSGPPARHGDEVSVYYAGAVYQTGKVRYGGWPPAQPASFPLGLSFFGEAWEESIEGMRAGGLREVIIPSHRLNGTGAVDYVIKLVALEPASGGR